MTRAAPAPSSAAASIQLADPVAVALAVGGMGDIAVVDEERRKRHAGVGNRRADFPEIGGIAAREMEVTDLQVADVARGDRLRQIQERQRRYAPPLLRLTGDIVAGSVRMEDAERAMHAPARHGNSRCGVARHRHLPEVFR